MSNKPIKQQNKRIVTESKLGVKTRNFSNANSVTWNLKRRFR